MLFRKPLRRVVATCIVWLRLGAPNILIPGSELNIEGDCFEDSRCFGETPTSLESKDRSKYSAVEPRESPAALGLFVTKLCSMVGGDATNAFDVKFVPNVNDLDGR